MAVCMDRLNETDLFYAKPVDGKTSQFDEKRFVESYLEKPKETLDKYGIRYDLNKMVYTFLFKYGYTVLGLRNYGRSYESETMYLSDWVFNTVREKAVECGLTEEEIRSKFGSSKVSDTYATYVCYGKLGKNGTLFGNIPDNIRSQCLNDYEFVRMMKPFEIQTVYIYKDEVDKVLEVFGDDYRKVILALQMIMRAKHFQADRLMFDGVEVLVRADRGYEDMTIIESRYWYTPCVRESSTMKVDSWFDSHEYDSGVKTQRMPSRYFKPQLGIHWDKANGTDRKNVMVLYNEVVDEMVQHGLFEKSNDYNGGLAGIESIAKYVDERKASKICLARIYAKEQPTNCYRPTFLTLEKDEVPVITITYDDYEKGYIFNFIEYLCSINAQCVKPYNKCKIVECKQCGKRFGVLYDGRSKGKTSSYCVDCSDGKARTKRSRGK